MATYPQINTQVGLGAQYWNLGQPNQDFLPDLIRRFILITPDGRITASNAVTLVTFLNGKLQDDARATRWQLSPKLQGVEFQGEDVQRETSGYGDSRKTRDATKVLRFELWGGTTSEKALRYYEDKADAYNVLFVDDKNNVIGEDLKGANGTDILGGFDMTDFQVESAWSTSEAKYKIYVTISLADSTQMTHRLGFYESGVALQSQLKPVVDVRLQNQNPNAGAIVVNSGSTTVIVEPLAGSLNLTNTFAAQFVQTNGTAVWDARVQATGQLVAITGAVVIPGVGVQLSLNVAALASGTAIDLTWKALSVLRPLGIEGYDANTLTIVLP